MITDIIIVTLIILCTFLGYKRGLIKVAVRFLSFVAALVIALILYTPISNYIIENTEIVPKLEQTISSKLYTKEEKEKQTQNSENIVDTIGNYIEGYTESAKENTSGFVAKEVSIAIVRVGTWIFLFIATRILALFIKLFADAIAEFPIIKQFNKLRRNNIWNSGRNCFNICISCSLKYSKSSDRRKCYYKKSRRFAHRKNHV